MRRIVCIMITVLLILSLSACGTNQNAIQKQESTESTLEKEKANTTSPTSTPQTPSAEKKSSSGTFTNKYGTSTTKCAHAGCDNYIASSGDTNCCTTHSNRCLDCNKYIDEDAMYCMDCLTKASKEVKNDYNSNDYNSNNYGSNDYDSSYGSDNIGAGGYEMPNESDKSFEDYVKRVDPELYEDLFSD